MTVQLAWSAQWLCCEIQVDSFVVETLRAAFCDSSVTSECECRASRIVLETKKQTAWSLTIQSD